MKSKICTKCKKRKLLIKFHRANHLKNKHISICKKCKAEIYDNAYSRKYREEHPEWQKESNRKNQKLINKLVAKYQKKYPERCRAGVAVRCAIKSGKLKKQSCVVCGKEKTVAHHQDYSKPLKVIWLCHKHHKRLHANLIKI